MLRRAMVPLGTIAVVSQTINLLDIGAEAFGGNVRTLLFARLNNFASNQNWPRREEKGTRMLDAIEVGQVVKLRSGGPSMTVEAVDGATAKCVWFDGAQRCVDRFEAALLRRPAGSESQDDIAIDNFG